MCNIGCPCQVMEAVAVEQKAKEMATAVGVVSEAARSMSTAQEDASVVSEAALQAAAALSFMEQVNSTVASSGANSSQAQREGSTLEAHERERKNAETESFALGEDGAAAACKKPPTDILRGGFLQSRSCCAGTVTVNLKQMQDRVQATLGTFETITAALEATTTQLRQEQAIAVSLSAATTADAAVVAAVRASADSTTCLLQERKAAERLQHQLEQEVQAQAVRNVTVSITAANSSAGNSTQIESLLNSTETAARAAVAASMGLAADRDPVDDIIERIDKLRQVG